MILYSDVFRASEEYPVKTGTGEVRLTKGMSVIQVRKLLGTKYIEQPGQEIKRARWTYSYEEGATILSYAICFKEDKLHSVFLHPVEQKVHNEGLSSSRGSLYSAYESYNIGTILNTARELQGLGRDGAIARLTLWAKANPDDLRTIVMCRMLFNGKQSSLRRPLFGGTFFPGGTTYDDWPTEPITIFEGIPILITQGYVLAGKAESAESYLSYCIREGLWVSDLYEEKTIQQIKKSLNNFLSNARWKEPLSVTEERLFFKQCGVE